jgi:hypothetical protein
MTQNKKKRKKATANTGSVGPHFLEGGGASRLSKGGIILIII